jgi:CRISPR type III-A-associated protein Csm2
MPSDHGRRSMGPPDRSRPQQESVRDRPESPRDREDIAAVLNGDATRIDEVAERLAMRLVRGLNRSQIRNFYGPIAIIRTKDDPEERKKALRMHRSRLAYLVARAGGSAEDLWGIFGELLKRAEGAQIDAVCDLAEAVVAYHRYYDEKEKNR